MNIKIMLGKSITLLLLILSMTWTIVSSSAPGIVTMIIGSPELVDICVSEECQYNLEFCIGSGRLSEERCFWLPKQISTGSYLQSQTRLITKSFEVDNIRSSFYFNANFSLYTDKDIVKTIQFKDSLFQYSSYNTTHIMSLHSENYESIPIELTVKCKSDYYPSFECTRFCSPKTGIYKCDSNGSKVCLEGFTSLTATGDCIKDTCRLKPDLCQNNSTCQNEFTSIRCICRPNYYGSVCENWNPCRKHKCRNSGTCIERPYEKDYICQCKENYYGTYCQKYEDPCKEKKCHTDSVCRTRDHLAVCVAILRPTTEPDILRWFSKLKTKNTTSRTTLTERVTSRVDASDITGRETVKLIQYPVQRDFTTIGIIIVLMIFMICCFTIIFWIQMNKFVNRRKKCIVHADLPQMPSVIPIRTQANFEDTIKRWRSLDDGFSNLWHNDNCSQFSILSYKSGFNTCDRADRSHDSYRFNHRHWPTNVTTRVSMANGAGKSVVNNSGGFLNESTQTDLEKIGDCIELDEVNDLPMPEE